MILKKAEPFDGPSMLSWPVMTAADESKEVEAGE
jgi:hypothetical protein